MYGLFTGLSVLSGTPLLVRSSSDSALTPQTEIEGSFSQETPVKVRPGRCPEKPSWTKTQPEQTEWWCSPEPPFSHLLHKWRGRAQIHRFGFKQRLTNKMLMSPFLHIFVIWSCGKQPFLMVPAEPGRRISTFCHLFLSINVGFLSFILSDFFLHKVHFPLHVFLKPQYGHHHWHDRWLDWRCCVFFGHWCCVIVCGGVAVSCSPLTVPPAPMNSRLDWPLECRTLCSGDSLPDKHLILARPVPHRKPCLPASVLWGTVILTGGQVLCLTR